MRVGLLAGSLPLFVCAHTCPTSAQSHAPARVDQHTAICLRLRFTLPHAHVNVHSILLAAVLLNHWSEEDAYWGLVAIVNDVLKGYYAQDMLAIQVGVPKVQHADCKLTGCNSASCHKAYSIQYNIRCWVLAPVGLEF